MRIPIYRAGSTPTSEAPGRSFRARASAAPFIRQAEAKASVFTAATKQIGEFAATRYKAAREAQINQKLLAGEAALREDARRLSRVDPGELGSIFNEGGNPEEGQWALATKTARESLLDGVTDPRSQQVLTDRFNQMELTYRYSLRGAIDTKLDAATQKTRADAATQFSQNIANATELNEAKLHANNFGINSVRLAQLGLGNPGALKKQEYNALYNGILGNIRAALNSSGTPVQDLEELRLTLRQLQQLQSRPETERAAGRETVLANSGAGRMQIGLLEMLPMNDAAKLLQSLGAGAAFFDAPSAEQQKLERVNQQIFKETTKGITDGVSMLQKGLALPDGYIETLEAQGQLSMPFVEAEDQASYTQGLADLRFLNNLSQAVKGVSNAKGINDLIQSLERPGVTEGQASLGLEFLRGFKADMEKQLKSDPVGYASKVGSVDVTPIDLSPQAVQNSLEAGRLDRPGATSLVDTGIPKRINDAIAIHGHYELDGPIKFLTPEEVAKYAPSLNTGTAVEKMKAITSIQQLFGRHAGSVLEQLSGQAPVTMHVAGLMQDGLMSQAEVIFKGVQEINANGVPIQGGDMRDAESEMFKIVGAAYELLPGELNANLKKNIKDVALAYYAEVLSRRVEKEYDEDLWIEAVQIATGMNGKSGGVQEVLGVQTILPPNRTVEEIETALQNITRENFSSIATSTLIDEELFNQIQDGDGYSLQALGRENGKIVYGVIRGEYGSEEFGVMTDNDGNDIMFTMEELVTASRLPAAKVEGGGSGAVGEAQVVNELVDNSSKPLPGSTSSRQFETIPGRSKTIGDYGRTTVGQTKSEIERMNKMLDLAGIGPDTSGKSTKVSTGNKKLNGDFLLTDDEFDELEIDGKEERDYLKMEARYALQIHQSLKEEALELSALTFSDIEEYARQNNLKVNKFVVQGVLNLIRDYPEDN